MDTKDPKKSSKPGNINKERHEGEECGGETDDGDHPYEVAGKGQLPLTEEHGGTGSRTVPLAHERVTKVWVDLELPWAPEAVVSLDCERWLLCGVRGRQQVLWTRIRLVAVWEPKGINKGMNGSD